MGDVVDMEYDEWGLDFHGLYTGKVNSRNKPDGFGRMISNENSSINNYEGLWKNGSMSDGKLEFNDGSAFVGTFEDGYLKYGTFTYSNGTIYIGNFAGDNLWNGYGTFYFQGGMHEGFWTDGIHQGEGKMTLFKSKDIKERECNGLWNAHGGHSIMMGKKMSTMILFDNLENEQREYIGSWNNSGMRYGKGRLTFRDGREYNGSWDNDHATNGTFTDNGVSYTGSWANAAPNCGTITWPTGFALEVDNACCIVQTYEQYMTLCTLQGNSPQECNDAVDPIFEQKIVSTEQDLSHPLLYHIERASQTPDIDIRLRLQHPIFANDLKNVQVCPECRYNYNKTDPLMKWVKLKMRPFAAVKIQRFFRTTSNRSKKRKRENSEGGNKRNNKMKSKRKVGRRS
jgi:hypothetical protein